MEVFSSRTNGQWLAQLPPPAPAAAAAAPALEDPAISEAKRALSDVLRCTNFVVLSGLGTSLCVQPALQGGAKAPTMRDLWLQVEATQNTPVPPGAAQKPTFQAILQLVGHPQDKTDTWTAD